MSNASKASARGTSPRASRLRLTGRSTSPRPKRPSKDASKDGKEGHGGGGSTESLFGADGVRRALTASEALASLAQCWRALQMICPHVVDGNGPTLFGTHPVTAPLLLYLQGASQRRRASQSAGAGQGTAQAAPKARGLGGGRLGGKSSGGGKSGGGGGAATATAAAEAAEAAARAAGEKTWVGAWLDATLATTTLPEAWRDRTLVSGISLLPPPLLQKHKKIHKLLVKVAKQPPCSPRLQAMAQSQAPPGQLSRRGSGANVKDTGDRVVGERELVHAVKVYFGKILYK